MKIDVSDSLLLEIYSIKNLESIKIYDLLIQNNSNKNLIIPTMMITYNGNKMLNLCSKDKYFDIYVKKVLEVYNKEKNSSLVIETPFSKQEGIIMDNNTKTILENGLIQETNKLFKEYRYKDSYLEDFIYEKDEVKLLLPLLYEGINDFLKETDLNIEFSNELSGYKNNYTIRANIDGIDEYLTIMFYKDEFRYCFNINNISEDKLNINAILSLFKNKIQIDLEIPFSDMYSRKEYIINKDTIHEERRIYKDSKLVQYDNQDLTSKDFNYNNLINLEEDKDYKYFEILKDCFIGINNNIKNINTNGEIINSNYVFLIVNDKGFLKKEYVSTSYREKKDIYSVVLDMTLDERVSTTYGYNIKDNIYLIGTYFHKHNSSNGYYNNYLAGKRFYKLAIAKNISEINKNNIIDIKKKQDILDREDVFNIPKVKKIVGA